MTQFDLLVDTPRARNSDPVTSHKAAARVKASGQLGKQQQLVLSYVQQFPGCTSAELSRHMAEARDDNADLWPKYRPMFGRRLSELNPGHIRRGEERKCLVCLSDSYTWYAR